MSGEKIDMSKITEMRGDKRIASNLKATDEQLVDDLNGVLSELQKKMMRTMLTHIGQLVEHIRDLGLNRPEYEG